MVGNLSWRSISGYYYDIVCLGQVAATTVDEGSAKNIAIFNYPMSDDFHWFMFCQVFFFFHFTFISFYSGISIKQTPCKVDISLGRTVSPYMDRFIVKIFIIRTVIRRALFSCTKWKFRPKQLFVIDLKTIFMKEVRIYFSLNCYRA